ncbi:hypothetical protein MNBD_GAMMA10-3134 [hydrothermal vent metagenome]|uniref:Uncharacterized protein n=1 Tax=hydrothermal vent metagenome TaxID=652676 RepID=A0A3B0XQA0_9ZZZZ
MHAAKQKTLSIINQLPENTNTDGITNRSERKDTRYSEASAAWMRVPSLQGCIYGDF